MSTPPDEVPTSRTSVASVEQAPAEIRAARRDAAIAWLEAHWGGDDYRCPVCSHDTFEVGDMYVTPPISDPDPDGPPAAYALIPLTCTNCGNVIHLNAVAAGLAPSRESLIAEREGVEQ